MLGLVEAISVIASCKGSIIMTRRKGMHTVTLEQYNIEPDIIGTVGQLTICT